MRFTQRQRHIVEQLHLVATDIDQLMVLWMQWSHRIETIDCQLVERHQIFAIRCFGVALHRHQMADVVVDMQLIQHLAFTVVPLGNHGIHIDRGVDSTLLGVVLGMQRTKTHIDLSMQGILQRNDRHAVGVFGFEFSGFDSRLNLLEAVYPGVAVQLTGDDDVFSVRADISTVRALGLWHQEQKSFLDGGIHHDHVMTIDLLGLASLDHFSRLLPVHDMQKVSILGRTTRLERRTSTLDTTDITL